MKPISVLFIFALPCLTGCVTWPFSSEEPSHSKAIIINLSPEEAPGLTPDKMDTVFLNTLTRQLTTNLQQQIAQKTADSATDPIEIRSTEAIYLYAGTHKLAVVDFWLTREPGQMRVLYIAGLQDGQFQRISCISPLTVKTPVVSVFEGDCAQKIQQVFGHAINRPKQSDEKKDEKRWWQIF